jgi:hypothetical protein
MAWDPDVYPTCNKFHEASIWAISIHSISLMVLLGGLCSDFRVGAGVRVRQKRQLDYLNSKYHRRF